ncbi:MAG TPA: OmpA family protein, partial [Albitalea sp.]|nr:OmpA family protein [Albitalea sp.]
MPIAFARSLAIAAALAATAAFVAGCAAPPQATAVSNELPFDQAVAQATDGLIGQTQKLPAFLMKVEAKLAKKTLVIDAMIDSGTGQQTVATKQLERLVTERLAANEQFEVLPFQLASLNKSQYLLTGTMTRVQTGNKGTFKINLALTELKSGNTVAQSSAVAGERGVDTAPTPYYRDSPVLVKDKVIEGYIRTAQTPPGQRADSIYFERIATATLIDHATNLYNNERYQDALGQFKNALSTPAGEQLRVLNGLYLTNFKLGRMQDAEQAFG